MGVVLLVRHGQASFDADDYDVLSPMGERQAARLGAWLAAHGVRPALVVHGDLRRQRTTAALAVEAAGWSGVPVTEDPRWDEFDHTGTHSGVAPYPRPARETRQERIERLERGIERWSCGSHDDEYVESFPAFQARTQAALDALLERLGPDDTALVVTSGGVISWIATSLVEGGVATWSRLDGPLMNASLTRLHVGPDGPSLTSYNEHGHLEDDEPLTSVL